MPTAKEIHDFIINRPHVFILGAGYTIATIPYGDKNGKISIPSWKYRHRCM